MTSWTLGLSTNTTSSSHKKIHLMGGVLSDPIDYRLSAQRRDFIPSLDNQVQQIHGKGDKNWCPLETNFYSVSHHQIHRLTRLSTAEFLCCREKNAPHTNKYSHSFFVFPTYSMGPTLAGDCNR